jgi:hypothetical protein
MQAGLEFVIIVGVVVKTSCIVKSPTHTHIRHFLDLSPPYGSGLIHKYHQSLMPTRTVHKSSNHELQLGFSWKPFFIVLSSLFGRRCGGGIELFMAEVFKNCFQAAYPSITFTHAYFSF